MSIRRTVSLEQAQWSLAPPPAWRLPREIDWSFRPPADEALAWLLLDEQHHVASQTIARRWVRQLLSIAAVQALAQVELEFEPDAQCLIVHELVIWRLEADGAWRKRTPVAASDFLLRQREQQLEQQVLNGRVSLVALLEDVRVGDVVDLAWTIEPRERLPGLAFTTYFPFAWRAPLAQVFFTLHLADEAPVRWRLHPGGDGPLPEQRESTGLVEWSQRAPPRFVGEDNVPGSHWHWPLLEVSGWDSWQAVARCISGLWAEALADGQAEVRGEAARLAEGASPEQAVLNVIRFVQEEVRYLAVDLGHGAGVLPSGAGSALRRRFGDCKDKSVLLAALLRALGVDAWPVLVASQWRAAVARLMPSAYAFDHAIVGLEWQGMHHYIDPTLIGQRGDLAHRTPPPYGVGLDLLPTADTLSELASARLGTLSLTERFELDRRGKGCVTQTLGADGFFADELRAILLHDGRQSFARQRADALQQRFPALVPDLEATGFSDDVMANALSVDAGHALPTWGKPGEKPPEAFVYAAYGLLLGLDSVDEHETRRQPWALRHPMRLHHRVIVHGRCVHRVRASRFEHEGPGFRYRCEVQSRRHEASFDYTWETTSAMVSAADWAEYRAQRTVALEQTGVLVNTQGMTFKRALQMGFGVLIAALWLVAIVMRQFDDGGGRLTDAQHAEVLREADAAIAALRRHDFAETYARFAPIQRHYGGNFDMQCLWAEAALRTGHLDEAEAAARRARRLQPGHFLPLHLEALLAEARGDFRSARATLDELAQRTDIEPDVLVDRARIIERLGDAPGARAAWEAVLARQPAQPDALYGLAHLLWLGGERDRADALIENVVRAQPMPSAVLESTLTRYYAATKRNAQALAAAHRARELAPADPGIVRQYAMAQLNAGQAGAAVQTAQAMTESFPDSTLAWSALAISAAVAKQYGVAEPAFSRWSELAPADPEALSSLGYFLHLTGRDERARDVLAQGTERFPAHGMLWLNYAVVLEALADPAAAKARGKANALLTPEQRAGVVR